MVGLSIGVLGVAAFGAMGLGVLFLAAEKGNSERLRNWYFASFALGMCGYAFGGVLGLVGGAAAWPVLAYTETKRGAPLEQPLRFLIFAECIYAAFVALVLYGGFTSLVFYGNICGIFTAIARGRIALLLMRSPSEG